MKSSRDNRPARRLLTVALASCLALGAAPAMAQSTGATIRGQVMADSAPAANAQVVDAGVCCHQSRVGVAVELGDGLY